MWHALDHDELDFATGVDFDEEDDDTWDDRDIPEAPGEVSGPVAPDGGATPVPMSYSLERDVAAMRRLLDRVEGLIDEAVEPDKLVLALCRLVESIARVIRIHHGVSGPPESAWDRSVKRAFAKRGWL
jgi:hypothetical protein